MNESNRTRDYAKTFFIVLVPPIYRWSDAARYGTPCTRKHVAKNGTREGVGSRHKLRQRSTFCDFMQSWCDKRHAPSLFSHEPLSSSHASTLVLPTSPLLFARVRGTRPKNEKKKRNQATRHTDGHGEREQKAKRRRDDRRPSQRLSRVGWNPGKPGAAILSSPNRLSHGAIPWERFNWPKKQAILVLAARPRSERIPSLSLLRLVPVFRFPSLALPAWPR